MHEVDGFLAVTRWVRGGVLGEAVCGFIAGNPGMGTDVGNADSAGVTRSAQACIRALEAAGKLTVTLTGEPAAGIPRNRADRRSHNSHLNVLQLTAL